MPSDRRAHRVMANAVYNLIPQLWFLGLTVFTTPFVLHRLGVEAYGILSIVTVVAGYLAFLDLGFNLAIIKFIAAHDAKGEGHEIKRVTQTALAVFLVIAAVTTMAFFFASGWLARILNVPEGLRADAVTALRLGAVSFGVNLVMGVFSAVPRALQRFDIVNLLNLVLGTLQIGGTVGLAAAGFGLVAVILWSCAVSLVSLFASVVIARRLLPTLSLRPLFDRKKFRELFSFSGFVMLSNFTGVASANSEKLILGGLAPIAQVTYYTIPFNLVARVLAFIPSNLFAVLFPAFSAMSATDKRDTIQEAYARAFRFIFLAVAPITILLIAFGADLLRFWVDDEMGLYGGPTLAVLAVAVLINAPAWVCVTVGQSLGRPALVALAQAISLVILIGSGLIFVPLYGAFGAALAWLAGNLIGIPVLILLVNRFALGFSTARMLKRTVARPLLASAPVLFAALAMKPMVHSFVSLAAASIIVALLYLALAYLIAFDADDRHLIKGFIEARRPALKGLPKVAKEQV
jgi:O-antigen/teichoic acid export membrane protein